MSDDPRLSFLPWMRRGLARSLAGAADGSGVPLNAAATVTAGVTIAGSEVTRELRVMGPGSVVGLSPEQVIREEPTSGTSDFETSHFAHVELLSPDLPWMFTPAAPNNERLVPWLVLVVVERREGVTLSGATNGRLAVLNVDDASRELPKLSEAWAWAHAQCSSTAATELADVDAAFSAAPETFCARLVAPRKLAVETSYYACVVPSFEQGRRAGLGQTVDPNDTTLAWGDTPDAVELPVYHSWSFRTATEPGDFETLVRRLTPLTLDPSAGVHTLDIGDPGSELLPSASDAAMGYVGYVGGLVAPGVEIPAWDPTHKEVLQPPLRDLVNEVLAPVAAPPVGADYDAMRDDPVVGPPGYGALSAELDTIPEADAAVSREAPRWVSDANLDPSHRAVAGVGAEVVRRDQEQLMASAWRQAQGARAVNRLLNRSRLALETGRRLKARVDAQDDGALLQFSRGSHKRLKRQSMATTLDGWLAESELPKGLVSGAFRRRLRSGTSVARGATKTLAKTAGKADQVTQRFLDDVDEMKRYAIAKVPVGTVFDTDSVAASRGRTGSLVSRLASRERVAARTDRVRALAPSGGTSVGSGGLTLPASIVRETLDPEAQLRVRVRALIRAPADAWTDEAVPAAMTASPEFPDPLYERVVRADPELLMPGVGAIPDDSVGLARVNPAFVEAFLLGANHELSRELIWREYPADPADTWLRTFWDSVDEGVEDIAPVRDWSPRRLGAHPTGMDPDQVLVVVVKGALLRRYPDTVIYAAPGEWVQDPTTQAWERAEDESAEPLFPSFVGSLGRDVVFLGFEFDASVDVPIDVPGDPERSAALPGWFFAFERPVTAPEFGLDTGDGGGRPALWRDLTWSQAMGGSDVAEAYVPLGTLGTLERPYDDEGENTWEERWARDAAAMARITLQRPVRMLVHADQMLGA